MARTGGPIDAKWRKIPDHFYVRSIHWEELVKIVCLSVRFQTYSCKGNSGIINETRKCSLCLCEKKTLDKVYKVNGNFAANRRLVLQKTMCRPYCVIPSQENIDLFSVDRFGIRLMQRNC